MAVTSWREGVSSTLVCPPAGSREVNVVLSSLLLFYVVQDPSCGVALCLLREGLSTASVKPRRFNYYLNHGDSRFNQDNNINHHSVPCHSSSTLLETDFMMSFMQSP